MFCDPNWRPCFYLLFYKSCWTTKWHVQAVIIYLGDTIIVQSIWVILRKIKWARVLMVTLQSRTFVLILGKRFLTDPCSHNGWQNVTRTWILISNAGLQIFPYRITAPLYMCVHTKEGCGLDLHILPYIEHTIIRVRAANNRNRNLTIQLFPYSSMTPPDK